VSRRLCDQTDCTCFGHAVPGLETISNHADELLARIQVPQNEPEEEYRKAREDWI